MMITPEQIIAGIKSGDESTLEFLYTSERSPFLAWAKKQFGCSESDAKDLYQIIVLIVYDNIQLGKLEQLHCSMKSYMYAIAKNKWKEWCRARQKEQQIDQTFLTPMFDQTPELSYSDDMMNLLRRGLQRLGAPCQQLLECFYYQKLNMTEIAANLGYKNASTAKNLKYKCLQRLKRMVIDDHIASDHQTQINQG